LPDFNLTRPAAAYLRKRLNLTPEEEELALYGLQTIVYPTTGLLTILLAGWLLGCFRTTLTAALTAVSLRLLSGGAHAKSPLTCNLLGMVIAPALGKTAAAAAPLFSPPGLALVVAAGFFPALVLVWRLAPVDSPAKPVTSLDQRRKLRRLSILALLLITAGQFFFLLQGRALDLVLAASLGLWWQTFTLTRAGHRFATLLDNFKERR
jgi:accessory gene regulator B